ncbi:MAG: A/G-specific adenine glycosylase [Armatimonadetes bacterium]|nr:A/G-specific adenine glycosylase [Armatimonadota bacterium]
MPAADDLPANAQDFRQNLLHWYEKNKRDLPWRRTSDPYAVWISETMLQQTQVATVIPYFARWMERFPTVAVLADAPLDDILQAWQGLGYYSRARNLHRAAKQIAETQNGVFPDSFTDVLALPGVGRYTAGAVCSIAGGRDTPIVDANVVRVLCRVFGVLGDPKATDTQAALWKLATDLLPPGNAGTFNQAMMELGALVCGSPPKCERCPVQSGCYAFATGAPSALPQFAPKPVFTVETHVSAVVEAEDGRVCLRQRPLDAGLWAGLWELPRVVAVADESIEAAAVRAATEAGFAGGTPRNGAVARVRHGVTTRKITLLAVPVVAASDTTSPEAVWLTPANALETLALPSPQRRLLEQILTARQSAATQPTLF